MYRGFERTGVGAIGTGGEGVEAALDKLELALFVECLGWQLHVAKRFWQVEQGLHVRVWKMAVFSGQGGGVVVGGGLYSVCAWQ